MKNNEVEVKKTKSEKSPDLCGYSKPRSRAYIFEAKGSTVEVAKFDQREIRKACEQLDAVTEAEFTHIRSVFSGDLLTKLALIR